MGRGKNKSKAPREPGKNTREGGTVDFSEYKTNV